DACSTNKHRQDACSTNSTGKMPVPQIQQARCLFHKFNRQDACSTNSTGFLWGVGVGRDARPSKAD
ncbi:hypothetical protein, partial [Microcoleus sp. T3_D1]|uniref:hypothetical protein n=1 Tax=Microcoleus sp. T3_D1 TaxID=3055427 RepID=UPI002FD3917B